MVSPGHLLANLIQFSRLLHQLGLDVNPGRVITLVEALQLVDLSQRADFFYTTRCILVSNKEDLPKFDLAFDLFWRDPNRFELSWQLTQPKKSNAKQAQDGAIHSPSLNKPPVKQGLNSKEDEKQNPLLELTQTYSRQDALRHKDFAELDASELETIKRVIQEMIWRLGLKRSRRFKPGPGLMIDMRRSLRQNLRFGGEILAWSYRRPKVKPRPLVIIADISGSMERYTRLLLHFVYGLSHGLEQPVEAFVFGTRLTRITRLLAHRDVDRVMREVSEAVPDWSGGTRIGEALKRFNFDWGRRVLGRGAIVLMISDGWDRGDPELLGQEIARLQRSCHRLIWLNPLLGSPDYEPLTRGMKAALPYIDDFLPIHNIASLEDLSAFLMRLDDHRPIRAQQYRPGASP